MRLLIVVIAAVAGVCCSCSSDGRVAPAKQMDENWELPTGQIRSKEQLEMVLEKRWSAERLMDYIKNTPPTPDSIQNLVAYGTVWNGELHRSSKLVFDRVWWYASTADGKLEKFSVNGDKNGKHWVIEIGNSNTLAMPPLGGKAN